MLYSRGREEDDPSECAVPISTALIKQIATKSNAGGTANEILADFYGCCSSPQSVWPYTKKDFVRYWCLAIFLWSCTTCNEINTFANGRILKQVLFHWKSIIFINNFSRYISSTCLLDRKDTSYFVSSLA